MELARMSSFIPLPAFDSLDGAATHSWISRYYAAFPLLSELRLTHNEFPKLFIKMINAYPYNLVNIGIIAVLV